MAFQFITGDLSVNKKQVIINKLVEIKENNPNARIFYLVPEHLKFDMETFLLKTLEEGMGTTKAAMIDLQVVSFTRLVWFLLPNENQKQTQISETGLSMLIHQILRETQEQLVVFRGQVHYQGFIEKLADLFNELYEGNVLPEDLLLNDEKNEEQSELYSPETQRLKELHLLYSAFINQINELEIAKYQSFNNLSTYLQDHPHMEDTYLVVDHHYYFNAQQMNAVMDMAQNFNTVWMTLPLTHSEAVSTTYQPLHDTFKNTYNQIKEMCQLLKIDVLPDWDISAPKFTYPENMLSLAQTFKQQQSLYGVRKLASYDYNHQTHSFAQFDTPQTEMKHLSNQIHYLVSEQGYRYKDILVVARDLDRYRSIVPAYFNMNDIPYFYDHVMKMNQHPFVLTIEGLVNLKKNNYQYQDLMSVLKSGLVRPDVLMEDNPWSKLEEQAEYEHQINLFENILIANGYFSYRFSDARFEWFFDTEDQAYINHLGDKTKMTNGQVIKQIRKWLLLHIVDPLKQWTKTSKKGRLASRWMYQLIETTGVKSQLVHLRDQAIDQENIEGSRRHEQVWDEFVGTLDEFYTLYSEEDIEYDTFVELLVTGLNEATYHIIPPTLDQVTFTNMESPQTQPYKVCFIVGADDHLLPMTHEFDSLLTEEYREHISEQLLPHQFLLDYDIQSQSQEVFLLYQLLLNATDHLFISYAATNNGQSLQVSPYINALITAYDFDVTKYNEQTSETQPKWQISDFGKTPIIRNILLKLMRSSYELSKSVSKLTLDLILLIKQTQGNENRTLRNLIWETFTGDRLPSVIKPETAIQLFGENMNMSVSRIEEYYSDPYSHFLLHGLRLRERDIYEIDTRKSGDYFHNFLDIFMQYLSQSDLDLRAISADDMTNLYDQSMKKLTDDPAFNILTSHPQFEAVKYEMDQSLKSFLQFTKSQQQVVTSEIVKTEAIFGKSLGTNLEGFIYPLSSGGKLTISGKIDRIDVLNTKKEPLLQVIDYKSSQRSFDIVDAYYGLDLQIITYLSVALNNYADHQPLGAFYQPIIHKDQDGTIDTLKDHQVNEQYQLEKNRLQGFITVDEDILKQVEPSLHDSNKSLIYPAQFKKNGEFSAASKAYNREELDLLMDYSHYMFKQAAEKIQSGDISLQPFRMNQYTTSLKQPYRVITGFDPTENYQVYREKNINKKQVLDEIRQILSNEGGNLE